MSDEKQNTEQEESTGDPLIKLMRYWLFGTFLIVFAAVNVFTMLWLSPLQYSTGQILTRAFPVWGATALLCLVVYVGYVVYATRRSK